MNWRRWGYNFLDLVASLRAYSMKCSETPFFSLDTMAVNQHTFFLGSTSDRMNQQELLEGLRSSLQACGTLVLVCMPGPSGAPGWMAPAPFERIWCLFELYVALTSEIPIMVQFGQKDAEDFRLALNNSGGRAHIDAALEKIDAEHAQASVPSDRGYILGVVEREMGMEHFNKFIREGLKREYKAISQLAAFGGSLLASNTF